MITHLILKIKLIPWSFLAFLGKAVVHEQNSDTWEFGKGALSELRFCGVAVLLCCSRKGERGKTQMPNDKYLITNTE